MRNINIYLRYLSKLFIFFSFIIIESLGKHGPKNFGTVAIFEPNYSYRSSSSSEVPCSKLKHLAISVFTLLVNYFYFRIQ